MRRRICPLLLLAASVLSAADFQDFQAARAVIGQPSFSAHDKGVNARALSVTRSNLYVADASGHLITYDVSQLGSAKTAGCSVCLTASLSSTPQNVFEGVAAAAFNGRTVVIADPKSRRVMIWRGATSMQKPDVMLSGFVNPISVAIDNQRLFVGDAGSHHVFIWNALPTSDSQAPDVTLGASENSDTPGADTIQTPSALAVDGANLFVADSAARRVLVFSPGDTAMPEVVNAATLSPGPLAPGTLVAIDHAAATSTVFLNGSPIRITESNGDQLQVQIPYDLNNAAAGSLWTRTDLADGSSHMSRPVPLRFTPASPGIFAFGTKEPRTGLLLHAFQGVPLSPEDPAKPGELLTVWANGLGAIASDANDDGAFEALVPVRAAINGNPVEVVSAILPAEATGVYEVRIRLPDQLPASASLVLLQNEIKSNTVVFPVEINHE